MVAKTYTRALGEQLTFEQIRTLTFLLFFLSGASALSYEVTWVRELSLAFGVSVYAVTAVLTAFMGGLALGSWLFGRLAARVAAPLKLYAVLQLGIALCALASPLVFAGLAQLYVVLYNSLNPGFFAFNLLRFALATLVLIIPATLMGGSFPVISQFLARQGSRHGSDLGLLYGANTFGGVIGAFATGLLLIRFLGAHGTIYVAAVLDLLVAASAALISKYGINVDQGEDTAVIEQRPQRSGSARSRRAQRYAESRARATAAAEPVQEQMEAQQRDAQVVWWAFAISGFVALGYEVAWTRLLSIFIMNTVYSFTIMLTTFLVGLAIGSLIMARRADRIAQPLKVFGYLQMLIGLSAIESPVFMMKIDSSRVQATS